MYLDGNYNDSSKNTSNHNLDHVIPKDVNVDFQKSYHVAFNINTVKGLVNGAMGAITEIIWPLFRRAQLYDQDIPAVKIDF
jgi:hypothetical protein